MLSWFTLVNGGQVLLTVLGAAVVHEMGHYVMVKMLGGTVLRVQLNVFGAVMEMDESRLSYGQELAVVLAGPAANFLCGGGCLLLGSLGNTFLGANLILGLFNLLPLRPLDGGRSLYLLVSWLIDPIVGETVARWIGVSAALLVVSGLGWIMWLSGGSLWLLPAAAGAIGIAVGETFGKR